MAQAELKQAEAVRNADEAEKLPLDHDDHEDVREHEHAMNWREINCVLFVAAAAAVWFLEKLAMDAWRSLLAISFNCSVR